MPKGFPDSRQFLVKSAASLYATTVVTSVLGFAYWTIAAHRLPPSQVGYASAVVSLMQLLGMLFVVGLNTLIISEVSAHPDQASKLLSTACLVALITGSVGALGVALTLRSTSHVYLQIFANPWAIPIFVVGVASTALTLIIDDACVATRRPSLQLTRNTVFSIVKLALIPLATVILLNSNGMQLLSAWVFSTLISFWFVRGLFFAPAKAGRRLAVDFSLLRSHARLALRHHWLNVSVQAPRAAIVAVAAIVVGPRLTAGLYAAILMIGFITIIPVLFSTVLFAISVGDTATLRTNVRFTLAASALLAVVATPMVYLIAGFALTLFSKADLPAQSAMWIMGLTIAPSAVKSHYVAITRVRGEMSRAARLTSAGLVLEVTFAAAGGAMGGITGIAIGWLASICLEALVFTPTVYRAAFPPAPGTGVPPALAG